MKLLVTGSTGGIGGAVKRAAVGWDVAELNRADFAKPDGEWPVPDGLDAVVFATGTCPVRPLSQLTDTEFAETVDVNCTLFVRLMRKIVRERLYNPAGLSVLAVSSVSAAEGWAGGTAYCASKGALSAVCRALDAELKPKRISVRAIEPRYVRTRMFDRCAGRMGVDPALAIDPDALARDILGLVSPGN